MRSNQSNYINICTHKSHNKSTENVNLLDSHLVFALITHLDAKNYGNSTEDEIRDNR